MGDDYHIFHIPVMATGHSVDTAIRVAPFGISSVISLVNDILLERIRRHYGAKYALAFVRIPRNEEDGRAKRITAYLDLVAEIVRTKLEAIKRQPFFERNDKTEYFELLPGDSPLKRDYEGLLHMKTGPERDALAQDLTRRMRAGSIDVNIMVKLDPPIYDSERHPLSDEYRHAMAALRGYAKSTLESSIVFSAGINQRLFSYMTGFRDFYRDKMGRIKKKIVLKVSDFRSARIQARFLARKGLEVHEFRIESGLNCGGHAFPTDGVLLPTLLQEFKEKREQLATAFRPLVLQYYQKMGWEYPQSGARDVPLITVQGGIGVRGEARRLMEYFGMDRTGWASPFLLVPEATCVDAPTRELLRQAGEDDLYVSDVSPLSIPFNNLRNSGSERWTRQRVADGVPGSPCPNGFGVANTEYTEWPICIASRQYQRKKLAEIAARDLPPAEKERLSAEVVERTCICDHLGNGALMALGIVAHAPQAICPGPNIAWFDRTYTLREMVDHIYDRGPSLVPPERPHMFAKEITMYVDLFAKQVARCRGTPREIKALRKFKENLKESMDFCLDIAKGAPYPGENLASIPPRVARERARLRAVYAELNDRTRMAAHDGLCCYPEQNEKEQAECQMKG